MTKLQLIGLFENITLHIKRIWDVPRNVFFQFWWRQATASQHLNYDSCRGGWGEHSSQRALRWFTQRSWIEHPSLRM